MNRTLTLSRPLDRLTTERLEQVGIVPEAHLRHDVQADNAHHRHIPADAATLAWNKHREAEWLAAPAAVEAMLRELAPLVFNDSPPPLAIGIDVALIALLAANSRRQSSPAFSPIGPAARRIWRPLLGAIFAATWTAARPMCRPTMPAHSPRHCLADVGLRHERR